MKRDMDLNRRCFRVSLAISGALNRRDVERARLSFIHSFMSDALARPSGRALLASLNRAAAEDP